jgi:hypothetical protein
MPKYADSNLTISSLYILNYWHIINRMLADILLSHYKHNVSIEFTHFKAAKNRLLGQITLYKHNNIDQPP